MNRLAAFLLVTALFGPAAAAETWLTYDRSGGFTGWSLKLSVDDEGQVEVVGTRQDPQQSRREPLSAEEQARLRGLVKTALEAGPRKPAGDLRRMADGMRRLVTVQDGPESALLVLSDGYIQAEGDGELIATLEAIAGRAPDASPPTEAAPAARKPNSKPKLDLVTVGPSGPDGGNATVLLLELPVGRADEAEGRAGTIELLLLGVLGARAELLLDDGPQLVDPDTGRWSLTITPVRTRLMVVLEDLPPSALRDTTARLRRLLQRAEPTLEQMESDEFDHQRRRLADAEADRADDPRVRRTRAARRAAWGERAGSAPSAFSVMSIEREDLRLLARTIRSGHARLVLAGALAGRTASLCSRGFDVRARGALLAPDPVPSLDGPTAPTNETLLAAPATELSSGLAGSLALELARRRRASSWVERLEPGLPRRPVAGDTLLVVAPGGAVRDEALVAGLRRPLTQLAAGLTQPTVDTRLRRRALGRRGTSDPVLLAREAADLLELGSPHPGSEPFDASAEPPVVDAALVRAAASALAEAVLVVPSGQVFSPRPSLLDAAFRAQLGAVEPSFVELSGGSGGATSSLRVEMKPSLALRLETEGEVVSFEAGRLTAGSSPASEREQALALTALSQPEVLLAGAVLGLFPARLVSGDICPIAGTNGPCEGLEVLVPARGAFRLLIEAETGQVWSVDRQDSLGRTVRLEMSDIREFEGQRRTAGRRVRIGPDGSRELLFEDARLRFAPR